MLLDTISSRDLLIDAYKYYLKGDAIAHDLLAIITHRNDMSGAVIDCLEKARNEYEPEQQKLYCMAACFGKQSYPGVAIEEYPKTCRLIRTQNICRSMIPDANCDPDEIIQQLIDRRKYDMALWVARFNGCDNESMIMTNWAEYLIKKRHLHDEEIATKILKQLGQNPEVSYAEIANKAIDYNRIKLAIKLIENEHQTAKKIPLLISLKQYDLVLNQAVATCDSNSIYSAIFKLNELIANEYKFLDLLKKNRHAFRYYCKFIMAISDFKKLINIQFADEAKEDVLLYLLDKNLESALAVSKRSKQDFLNSQIDSQIRLNKWRILNKKQLDSKPPPILPSSQKSGPAEWDNLSISDTIINLIALGYVKKAREVQKLSDVTERKYKVLEQIALGSLPKLDLRPVEM